MLAKSPYVMGYGQPNAENNAGTPVHLVALGKELHILLGIPLWDTTTTLMKISQKIEQIC